jgi:endonuclease-3
MRDENPAAVDTMGAHKIAGYAEKTSKNEQAFHTLIGLMLSSQTKDEVTSATMQSLI